MEHFDCAQIMEEKSLLLRVTVTQKFRQRQKCSSLISIMYRATVAVESSPCRSELSGRLFTECARTIQSTMASGNRSIDAHSELLFLSMTGLNSLFPFSDFLKTHCLKVHSWERSENLLVPFVSRKNVESVRLAEATSTSSVKQRACARTAAQ